MKALRFEGQKLRLSEVGMPNRPDEAVIRVTMSGICNTDLEIVRGYAGFEGTIGHEFVGVVERTDDQRELVGQRVVGEINAGCGRCEKCLEGDPRHCPERTVLGIVGRDGAHAEYLNLPARNLIVLPDNVPDEKAVFVEPLAAALGITERVNIAHDTKVAVVGDGKLGLLCALALARSSQNVALFGRHEEKMKVAENAGIDTCLSEGRSSSFDRRFDVVIEVSGSERGFACALDLVRPRGQIVLKSTFQGNPTWAASRVVVDEVSIVGSRCGRFAPAVDLLSSGQIDPTPMISDTFALADGIKAMDRAGEKGVLKVLLLP